MDMYRRNTWKDWWEDVGYIYVIAIALVVAVFFFQDLAQTMSGLPSDPGVSVQNTSVYP
jgi:hypothetical protein